MHIFLACTKTKVQHLIVQKDKWKMCMLPLRPSQCLISYHDNQRVERIALVELAGKVSLFLLWSALITSQRWHIIFLEIIFSPCEHNQTEKTSGRCLWQDYFKNHTESAFTPAFKELLQHQKSSMVVWWNCFFQPYFQKHNKHNSILFVQFLPFLGMMVCKLCVFCSKPNPRTYHVTITEYLNKTEIFDDYLPHSEETVIEPLIAFP